jgi:hypothetical protein
MPTTRPAVTDRERDPSKMTANIKDIDKIVGSIVSKKRVKGRPHKYSDEQKKVCLALWSQNLSFNDIELATGVPRGTVHSWTTGQGVENLEYSDTAELVKNSLASHCILGAKRAITASLEEEKISKASALQLGTLGAMLIDKARLLSGESTSNILNVYHKMKEHKDNTEDIEHEIAALEHEVSEES